MAPSIIASDAVQGEAFLPGQIFIFGGFALRANSLGHLEQIESSAPGHQVRFGNLNYTADNHGDLIFDGFEPVSGATNSHDAHDLDLPPDGVVEGWRSHRALQRRHRGTLNESTNVGVKTGGSRVGGPELCV